MESSPGPQGARLWTGRLVQLHAGRRMAESRSARVLGVWAVGWVLASCAGEPPAKRLHLNALETHSLAADGALEVSGEALPFDRTAQLELRGVMHSPGRSDRVLHFTLAGRVLSPERISASVDAAHVDRVGRGTFEGSLEARSEDPANAHWRGSLSHVQFDVDGPSVPSAEELRRNAQALLRSLNVDISDDASRLHGLVVTRVQAKGLGARAGLRVGDVIELANGVRIHALSDLAPAASGSHTRVAVRHAGAGLRTLLVPLQAAAPFADSHLLGLYLLACPVLALLLWLAPWPTPGTLLARCLNTPRLPHGRGKSLGIALACLFGGASGFILDEGFDVFAVTLAYTVIVLLATGRVVGAWSGRLAHALVIWLGVVCAAALSGTSSWLTIVNDQGALPWEWNLLARPPLALACTLCLWHAARLHGHCRPQHVLDSLSRGLLAALLAALFLGGARHAPGSSRELMALGSALGAAKSLVLFAALGFLGSARHSAWRRELPWLFALPLCTAAWSWLAPSRAFEVALGAGACLFFTLVAAAALIEQQVARHAALPVEEARAEPFG